MTPRLAVGALLALLAAASPWPAAAGAPAAAVPPALLGDWVITSAVGDRPAYLEVAEARELVGKHITVTPQHVALWTVYDGHPGTVQTHEAMLREILSVPASVRDAQPFPEADRTMRFFEVSLDRCRNDGRAVGSCIPVVFAQDPATGALSLVTVPWGLAHLQKR